jgi:hypothetical protein
MERQLTLDERTAAQVAKFRGIKPGSTRPQEYEAVRGTLGTSAAKSRMADLKELAKIDASMRGIDLRIKL